MHEASLRYNKRWPTTLGGLFRGAEAPAKRVIAAAHSLAHGSDVVIELMVAANAHAQVTNDPNLLADSSHADRSGDIPAAAPHLPGERL